MLTHTQTHHCKNGPMILAAWMVKAPPKNCIRVHGCFECVMCFLVPHNPTPKPPMQNPEHEMLKANIRAFIMT